MTVEFRCLPELEAILPPPIPAVQGLPGWFKALPTKTVGLVDEIKMQTVKKCPPFIDAMGYGFLMPLVADLKIENGEFSWEREIPAGTLNYFSQSPIDFHDSAQVAGTPFFDDDRFIVKFNNYWAIETPPGYSLLFTHPLNRIDLPFTTISGIVDTDSFSHGLINFPARWHDADFNGVLPKGTPVAQCIPIKRENWRATTGVLAPDAIQVLSATSRALATEEGVYRRTFRAPKR
jgi:hypothetical protein